MHKDFDGWNSEKKRLDEANRRIFFKAGEIRRTSVGINLGSESCGKGDAFRRPVLILKKLSSTSCIGLPLTSKNKIGTRFAKISMYDELSRVLLYQIRMFSTLRFQRRLLELDDEQFLCVKEKLKQLLEL